MSRFAQGSRMAALLAKESRLPGPRANLELLTKFVEESTQASADLCLAALKEQVAPDTPMEFVAMCGVAAIGKMLSQGLSSYAPVLRTAASHSSARVREGVVCSPCRLMAAPTRLPCWSSSPPGTRPQPTRRGPGGRPVYSRSAERLLDLAGPGHARRYAGGRRPQPQQQGRGLQGLEEDLELLPVRAGRPCLKRARLPFEEWTQSPGLEVRAILEREPR